MSAKPESQTPAGTTKKFGKGERYVPHSSVKAKRYYPAEDETKPKTVRRDLFDEHCVDLDLASNSQLLADLRRQCSVADARHSSPLQPSTSPRARGILS